MNVQDIVNQTATTNRPSTADRVGSQELGKDSFLKLMLAQLANQDPTQPQDSQAFVAQLAQFSSVEQLEGANKRLDDILLAQASNSQTAATAMVGNHAAYRTDQLNLAAGKPAGSGVWLGADAAEVTITVLDGERTVRTMNLGAQQAGQVEFAWNGQGDDGGTSPPGNYQVRVTATDKNGEGVTVDARGRGLVKGVSFEQGYPELLIGADRVAMSQIVEINQRSNP